MTWLNVTALAGAMLVLAAIPGPGVFATVARALSSGFSHASVVVAGIVLGDLIFLLLAIYGLAAIAGLLGGVFTFVRYVGGLYLIWLGYQIWTTKPQPKEIEGILDFSWASNFLSGLLITLGNPKVILFYLGFLPTFIDLATLTHADVLLVALVVSLVLGSVLIGYSYAATQARRLFVSSKASKNLNRSAAGVMVATGTVLLAKT